MGIEVQDKERMSCSGLFDCYLVYCILSITAANGSATAVLVPGQLIHAFSSSHFYVNVYMHLLQLQGNHLSQRQMSRDSRIKPHEALSYIKAVVRYILSITIITILECIGKF